MQLRRKRFDRPDETRALEKGRVELVELGEAAIGRATFEPGWRWSDHVKPIVETESCEVHHLGYVVSGHLHVEMTDGASIELTGGDAFEVPPGTTPGSSARSRGCLSTTPGAVCSRKARPTIPGEYSPPSSSRICPVRRKRCA